MTEKVVSRGVVEVHREDRVAWIEMKDPAHDNGFYPAFLDSLMAAFEEVSNDKGCHVVVLAGLPEIFSSGGTKEMLIELKEGTLPPTELLLGRRLMEVPVPVICAAEGLAVGGGLGLLFSGDMYLLARESRYGANFVSLGITPGMGTTKILEQVLPPSLAHEMLYTGAYYKGRDLEQYGVRHVLPRAEVRPKAAELAWRISMHSRDVLTLLKRTLSLPRRRAFEDSYTLESLMHQLSLRHLDLAALANYTNTQR
jgi:polyketide biosynthesis enoyl-CoA hydratase PksI